MALQMHVGGHVGPPAIFALPPQSPTHLEHRPELETNRLHPVHRGVGSERSRQAVSAPSEHHHILNPTSWTDKPLVSGRVPSGARPGQECWCVDAGEEEGDGDYTAHIVDIYSVGRSFGGVM